MTCSLHLESRRIHRACSAKATLIALLFRSSKRETFSTYVSKRIAAIVGAWIALYQPYYELVSLSLSPSLPLSLSLSLSFCVYVGLLSRRILVGRFTASRNEALLRLRIFTRENKSHIFLTSSTFSARTASY